MQISRIIFHLESFMKKKLVKIIALILTFILALGATACDLVTVDTKKAYHQEVISVKVFADAPAEKITNGQLHNLYSTYAQNYVAQGMTAEEALDEIVEQIIKDRILAQVAINYFYELGSNFEDLDSTIADKWNPERYLTARERAEALYNVNKAVNDSIESFMEEDEETSEEEGYAPEVRTVPTDATNYVPELSMTELTEYKIDTGIASSGVEGNKERRTAYYKLLKTMEANGFIEDTFNWMTDSIEDTEYYKQSKKEQLQNIIIQKLDLYLAYDAVKNVTMEQLSDRYADIYAFQESSYTTYTDYTNALSDAKASNPVVYNPFAGNFGYVQNLLLGVSDTQSAQIEKLKEDLTNNKISKDEYKAERENILSNITVTDLRDTWITSGYDFDFASKKFLNDYNFSGFAFNGEVEWTNKGDYKVELVTSGDGTYAKYYTGEDTAKVYDDEYVPEYKATANKLNYATAEDLILEYIYGAGYTKTSTADYKAVVTSTKTTDYAKKINDLLFAFSTDPGSLNTYKGYAIAKDYDINYSETYVDEFAKAGRELLEMAKAGNDGSCIIVATDFGYHVMFWSEITNVSYATLSEYLTAIGNTTSLDDIKTAIKKAETNQYKNDYLYSLFNSVASSKSSAHVETFKQTAYNTYLDDTTKVIIENDLIGNYFGLDY